MILYGAARITLLYQAHRARSFFSELHAIPLGASLESIEPFLAKYEDVDWEHFIKAEDVKIVFVDPYHFQNRSGPEWIAKLKYEVLNLAPDARRKLGLRCWQAVGDLTIENGKVASIYSGVLVEGESEWLWGEARLIASLQGDEWEEYKRHGMYRPEMERYFAGWSHLHMGAETGEVLHNAVSSIATTAEMRAARTYNLQCLTSWKGCHSLCELMPDAARYRKAHNYPPLGHNSGSWAPQDTSCE